MRGDRDSAVVFYRRALGFARDAVAASPYNTDAARDLSIVYGTYGLFLANGGDIDSALAVSDSSMAILEDLAAKDPDNVLLQSDVAEAGHDIGDVLMKARRFQSAERQFGESYERFEAIATADTANAESRIFMARCSRSAGEACRRLSDQADAGVERSLWRSRALTWLSRSREIYRGLAAAGRLSGEETAAPRELDRVIAGLQNGGGSRTR